MGYDRDRVRILSLHQRLAQDATNYLKGLEFDELTAIESGDTLKCSGYVNPYVVSNESHFFGDANIYTTLTELSWSIPAYLETDSDVVIKQEFYKRLGSQFFSREVRRYTLNVYTNTSMKNRKVMNKDKYGL